MADVLPTDSGRRPKASDIPDAEILRVIEALCVEYDCWTFTGYVADRLPRFPYKVVAAKLDRLERRGLATGCACGCRGDWELTSKGRALAGIESAWRPNPMEGR